MDRFEQRKLTRAKLIDAALQLFSTSGYEHAAAGGDGDRTDIRSLSEAMISYGDERRWPGMLLEFWAQSMRNDEVKKRLTQTYSAWRDLILNEGLETRTSKSGKQ